MNGSAYEEEFDFATSFYADDICAQQLKLQLDILRVSHAVESGDSLSSLCKYLRTFSTSQRMLCKNCKTYSSNASYECCKSVVLKLWYASSL